mmetsp:Transcript_8130/g.17182  ORF Transcript_8130/g.17182 Transcript_8130/m.17182 type:complete len:463 (-) Transcript_8130:83-1471(-)
MLLLTGGVMFAEGAEMLVMGSMTTLLRDHWDLDPVVRGLMVSVVFVGFSMGNVVSGMIGDRWGRRRGVIIGYALMGCFGLATACAWGPRIMLTLRFGVGVGCGVGFPAVYSLIPEVCPTSWRSSISTLMIGFMPLGELFAASGVMLIDPYLDHDAEGCELGYYYPSRNLVNPEECSWKALSEYSAIPAVALLFLSARFLCESPAYLAARGSYEQLEEVLSRVSMMNGRELDLAALRSSYSSSSSTKPALKGYSFADAAATLWSPRFRLTTIFMCFAHFVKDFTVFGLSYVLPQYFKSLRQISPGAQLSIVAVLAIPGVALAFLVSRSQVTHVHSLACSAGLCGFFALGMLAISPTWLAGPCVYMVKILALSYFIFTVVYTAEVFPTAIRNTAVGLCTCVGRLGSISAPLLFEVSRQHSNSFDGFTWMVISSTSLIAVLAPICLTHDSKGKLLNEDAKSYGSA